MVKIKANLRRTSNTAFWGFALETSLSGSSASICCPSVLFQSGRGDLLHRLRRPLPAERRQPAPVNAWREPGGDSDRLQRPSAGEGHGAGPVDRPGNLVRLHPAGLLARRWHPVPEWHAVLRHRLGEHAG